MMAMDDLMSTGDGGGGKVTAASRLRMLGRRRTGHARFRRGPVAAAAAAAAAAAQEQVPPLQLAPPCEGRLSLSASASASSSLSLRSTTALTGVTAGEGSVSGGRGGAGGEPPALALAASDHFPGSERLDSNCHGRARSENDAGAAGGKPHGGRCHCSKKRKSRVRWVTRVPAISSRNADIPPDDYSWRKYGQKPIKGSPFPRGYYKCSTVRWCPARKHVERDPAEPAMLIVTYDGEHRHDGTGDDPERPPPIAAAAGVREHTATI
ncbi:hypothetical protein ACP4OV_023054 [Aristida adscensionis]